MRFSEEVKSLNRCCKAVRIIKTPKTTHVAIDRPSSQFQSEPANVMTNDKDTSAPEKRLKPIQSNAASFFHTFTSEASGDLTEGR